MSEINVNLTVITSDVLDKLLEKKPQDVQNFMLDINDDMNNLGSVSYTHLTLPTTPYV